MSAPATETSQTTPAGQQAETTPQTGQPQAPAAAEPKITPAEPKQTEQQLPADETPEAKAARLEAEVTRLRRENGKERVSAKQQAAEDAKAELAQTIGKALGLIKDDQPVDPAVLTAQLQQAQAASRMAEVKLSVYQNAGDGDPVRLLDSQRFLESIKDVKPDDTEAIKAAIKTAITDNPWLKASPAQAAGKGGTEFSGGTGEGAISKERFKAMSGKERNDLFQSNPTLYNQLAGRE